MPVGINDVEIKCDDSYPLGLTVFTPKQSKGVVIVASALGVPQIYYRYYARYLMEAGYIVLTFDYRGTGASVCSVKKRAVSLAEWGTLDVKAAIDLASSIVDSGQAGNKIYYVGHSIGGQVVGLASNVHRLDKIIMVAASAPYWRRWKYPGRLKVGFAMKFLIPTLLLGRKSFPAKRLGLGTITLPAKALRQWARWMTQSDYLFSERFRLDISNYAKIEQPILFYGFTDDELVPSINIKRLESYFPNANTEIKMIEPQSINHKKVGHSGFFKDKFKESLWVQSLAWLETE